jgi:hypothetical protein
MNKPNLIDFFKESDCNISDLIEYKNILSIQILHLYYNIKDWYFKNKCEKIKIHTELLDTKDYINNQFNKLNISNLTNCAYNSILYNETPIYSSYKDNSCLKNINYIYQQEKIINSIHIITENNIYIIFNYLYYKKVLLIDIATLNITEFNSLENSIIFINNLTDTYYKYQIVNIIKRPYDFNK